MNGVATGMDHLQVRECFGSLVDHDLPASEEAQVRTHLEHCRECQQGFENYERAVTLVRGVGRERAPVDLASHVLRRIRKRRRLWGAQGARFFEHVSLPVEAAIPVLLAAIVAALLLLAN